MSIWYVGIDDVRSIASADWTIAGVNDASGDFVWDQFNGFSIDESVFSAQQLAYLEANDEFWVNAPEGPRSYTAAAADGFVTRSQLNAILRSTDFGTLTGLSRASVGLDRVDNTSDADKPLSDDAVAALLGKADYPSGGTDAQVLVKSGSTTAWAAPGGGSGSVGVSPVSGDGFWSNNTLFNITGSGVAQAPDDSFWSPGTLYTVN